MPGPSIIRGSTIRNFGIGFQAKFQGALAGAPSLWDKIATLVPSGTREEDYGWLLDLPRVREWIGDRVVRALAAGQYTIRNKDWELTIGVDRNDIEDDNLAIYEPKARMMAEATGDHKSELSYQTALKAGFTTVCYDGQYYFDTDHPILDANGAETTFANTDGGGGNKWFLASVGGVLKPIILQLRRDYNFVSKDSPNDDGVFFQKKFVYGADARYNAGYSLPQLCWGSGQTLDATHYNTARAALYAMKGDHGKAIVPTKMALFVGPSNIAAAEAVIKADKLASGATNTNYGTAELVIVPWLD